MSKEVKRFYIMPGSVPALLSGDPAYTPMTNRLTDVHTVPLVLASDYDALLAERDRLREALERFYSANQARLKLLSREAYLDMQRLPGMRDALYEMDDAQHQAYAALQGAQS